MSDLEDILRETIHNNPPPDLAGLSRAERDERIDGFIEAARAVVPETFELDVSLLSSEIPDDIALALDDAQRALDEARVEFARTMRDVEDDLVQPRDYAGYFYAGFYALIAAIVVLAIIIAAVHRQVSGASLHLGITFLVFGLIGTVGVLLARALIDIASYISEVPVSVAVVSQRVFVDATSPMLWLSIGFAVFGVVVVALGILYSRTRPAAE
jgi:hypothetical protein